METQTATVTLMPAEKLLISLGNVATLTEGQGKGSSEDKRRAYN